MTKTSDPGRTGRCGLDTASSLLTALAALVVMTVAVFGRPGEWFREPSEGPPVDTSGQQSVGKGEMVVFDASPRKGDPAAPIVIVEFSDFQCPFCRRFATDLMPAVTNEFLATGQVLWVFKNLPLTGLHPEALHLANVGSCLPRVDDFWSFYSRLFASPTADGTKMLAVARSAVGADIFGRCPSTRPTATVAADMVVAARLGIRSTPTFLIGRRIGGASVRVESSMAGAKSVEDFRRALSTIR